MKSHMFYSQWIYFWTILPIHLYFNLFDSFLRWHINHKKILSSKLFKFGFFLFYFVIPFALVIFTKVIKLSTKIITFNRSIIFRRFLSLLVRFLYLQILNLPAQLFINFMTKCKCKNPYKNIEKNLKHNFYVQKVKDMMNKILNWDDVYKKKIFKALNIFNSLNIK